MGREIHPSAIVDPKAILADGVRVGPYALIGPNAKLGEHVTVHNHATVTGDTTLGAHVTVHPLPFMEPLPLRPPPSAPAISLPTEGFSATMSLIGWSIRKRAAETAPKEGSRF